MNKRIDYIDSAKGIGILFVLIGHACSLKYGLGQYFYSFHMPLFFIISGMLLCFKDNWKDMDGISIFKKKIKSLFYPYIVFSILGLIFIYFTKDISYFYKGIIDTVSLDGIGALWFLPSLLIGELVFIYVMKYCKKYVFLIFGAIFVVTSLICYFANSFGYFTITGFENYVGLGIVCRSLIASIFILLGYYLFDLKDKISHKWIVVIVCFMVNLLLFRYNVVNLHYCVIGNTVLYYLNSITGSIAYIGIAELLLSSVGFLIFYGKNSLIVFVTQGNLGILRFSEIVSAYVPVGVRWVCMVLVMVVLETILILLINKWFRFLLRYDELKSLI